MQELAKSGGYTHPIQPPQAQFPAQIQQRFTCPQVIGQAQLPPGLVTQPLQYFWYPDLEFGIDETPISE